MMLPPTFDSKGGNGVFVPKRRTCFAAGACPNTSHPAPRPAANVTMATITARTAETPRAPRTASVGGAPPPAAIGGANACHYLNVTGRRTVGTGHELPGTRWRSRCGPLEAFLEHVEAGIEHIPRDVQRRDVSHRRIATREQDQTVLVRVLLNRVTTLRIRFLRMLVHDELRRLHHPEAAAVSDELVSFGHLIKPLREVLPNLRAPGHEALLFDYIESGQGCGARDRVAAERVRMLPALLEVHLRGIHRGADRQPAAQRLGHRQDVRDSVRVLDRPHLSGPAEA